MEYRVRAATLEDLPSITQIRNHYVIHTHITFDIQPHRLEDSVRWFHEHSDGVRYHMLVACDPMDKVLGYTCSGRFRSKEAYDTTVEVSIACHPDKVGSGVGRSLYSALFELLADQDVNRIVAGIAQPNRASNALHKRLGFQPVGLFTQVGRKFDKYWDVLWMERPPILG